MIKNYFLIGLRNLRKRLSYSIINVFGLTLGLATTLLLVSWIKHELSYDRFHVHSDRLFRVSLEYSFGGQTAKTSVSPTALLPTLQKNFGEIERGTRIYNPSSWQPFVVRYQEKLFQEGEFFYADSTFFDVFTFPLLAGNPNEALTAPKSVVITQSTAKKYFGNENAVGKIIEVNNGDAYTVTGLVADPPSNSLIQFDFIGSFSSLKAAHEQIWWSANYGTYVVLNENTNLADLADKTNAIVKEALASELTNPGDYVKYNFMPITDIYLRSDVLENQPVGNIQYVYIFSSIALLVLIIACVNYINLATARATDRAKEVGIRKVVGAHRNQLFGQFISESILVTLLSLSLAFVVARIALPNFNTLAGKNLSSDDLLNVPFVASAVGISLVVALISGIYPALVITSFKPAHTLKGNFKNSIKGIGLRKSLVVFQFSLSIVLIVGTLVVLKQLSFIQNKRVGYDKDNLVILPLDRKTAEVYTQLKSEVFRKNIATNVARATESPTHIAGGYSINFPGSTGDRGMIVTAMAVDPEFIPAFHMELVAGRNFSENDAVRMQKDTVSSFILNETALKELSLDAEKAVGTPITMNGRKGEIVGIVKDFHFATLMQKISPLVLFTEDEQLDYIFLKLKGDDLKKSLTELEAVCKVLIPHRPFEYSFVDEKYNALYQNEQRMGKISSAFAALAILIAGMGLFGLVSYTAAQRTKEIGVRKVLGASVLHLVLLISKDFIALVLIALAIGLPASYWIVLQWLNDFAYQNEIGILPVLGASFICLIIAFGTAGIQALKAALINPTDTLRSE